MNQKLVIGREVAYTDDGDVITVSDFIFLDIYNSNAV